MEPLLNVHKEGFTPLGIYIYIYHMCKMKEDTRTGIHLAALAHTNLQVNALLNPIKSRVDIPDYLSQDTVFGFQLRKSHTYY